MPFSQRDGLIRRMYLPMGARSNLLDLRRLTRGEENFGPFSVSLVRQKRIPLMTDDVVIRVHDIHRRFDGHEVLKGVTLDVLRGQTTVVIGRSGIGKSVLLKHIIGLLKPDVGQIFIDGEDVTPIPINAMDHVRRKFGMLFQNAALFDSMNVLIMLHSPLGNTVSLVRLKLRARCWKSFVWWVSVSYTHLRAHET